MSPLLARSDQFLGLPDEPYDGISTASSIPAALQYFQEKFNEFEVRPSTAVEDDGLDYQEAEDLTDWRGAARQALHEIAKCEYRMPDRDSKLEELLSAFRRIWEDDDQNKIRLLSTWPGCSPAIGLRIG